MNIIKEQIDRIPSCLKVPAIVLQVIGIFLRLYNMDGQEKVYPLRVRCFFILR